MKYHIEDVVVASKQNARYEAADIYRDVTNEIRRQHEKNDSVLSFTMVTDYPGDEVYFYMLGDKFWPLETEWTSEWVRDPFSGVYTRDIDVCDAAWKIVIYYRQFMVIEKTQLIIKVTKKRPFK